MSKSKEEFKEFSIRVPVEIIELLEEDGRTNKRSRSKQVNYVLEKHYADELSKKPEAAPATI